MAKSKDTITLHISDDVAQKLDYLCVASGLDSREAVIGSALQRFLFDVTNRSEHFDFHADTPGEKKLKANKRSPLQIYEDIKVFYFVELGITLAMNVLNETDCMVAISRTNFDIGDTFSRKRGRFIAEGRLLSKKPDIAWRETLPIVVVEEAIRRAYDDISDNCYGLLLLFSSSLEPNRSKHQKKRN